MQTRLGEFHITGPTDDGLSLLIFRPRDKGEAEAGCPMAAFALWSDDRMQRNIPLLLEFVSAALAASHGDPGPMNKLCPPGITATAEAA